ncbi:hypothetical protein BDZ85DRAFT_89495 [Elsinoe ampelina]|uniref:Uncharacterized protein n=1 Tax=Elsinoe ampelina TaxID=302913 RepID=A0A6A6GHL4_9PEZI|nr:hypothetical protein BDZ85DRAFT_89495 [Elsinoe ampelina]
MLYRTGVNRIYRRLGHVWKQAGTETRRSYSSDSSIPRIASASLWSSIIPKPFRRTPKDDFRPGKVTKSRDWNPATFFIVISLLIGSNAIQLVSLKTHRLNYNQSTDAKLSLLREVIGRVKKGEDVNVEAMLGKGDPEREKEWEEVMRDLEKEEDVWAKNQVKKDTQKTATETTSLISSLRGSDAPDTTSNGITPKTKDRKPGFY